MANDNKKTAAARGKQSVSRARKSASLNASSQVVGQRARRFGACASAPRTRAQAKRIAAGLSVGAHRVKKASREGLWYVSVARDNRSLTRESCREARCVLAALPEKRPYVSAATHASMQGNKSKDTKPELLVRERLREAGLGGYRPQWKAPGRPDVAWPGKKVCLLINGCFWHRCPKCNPPAPKKNLEYWVPKFQRNVERDQRNLALLQEQGWRVHVIWECELKKKTIDATFESLIPVLHEELGK